MERKNETTKKVPDIEPVTFKTKKVAINQYDLEGHYLQTFQSISQAAKLSKTSINGISMCVNDRAKTAGEFQWRKAKIQTGGTA